jgi:hypothetical protein
LARQAPRDLLARKDQKETLVPLVSRALLDLREAWVLPALRGLLVQLGPKDLSALKDQRETLVLLGPMVLPDRQALGLAEERSFRLAALSSFQLESPA